MANELNHFGVWHPWHPYEVARFFFSLAAPWWVAGGWALDLFLGAPTRAHEDIGVQILRQDQEAVRALLHGWDMSRKQAIQQRIQLKGLCASGSWARP